MNEPYVDLANAIVICAADDYREAWEGKQTKTKTEEIKDLEKFFLSDWFKALTSADGKMILKRLQEEVMKK